MKRKVINPFFEIVHHGDEEIIIRKNEFKKIKSIAKNFIKKPTVVFIVGNPGSGKSIFEKEIKGAIPKKFEKRELIFTSNILNELRAIPAEKMLKKNLVMLIDKFELSDALDDEKLRRILDLIALTVKSGVWYVISLDSKTLARIFELSKELKKNSIIYNVPALTFEQTKKLVASRLNMIRKKKSNSIEPFNEKDLKNIWKASNGNPRMILLLCANLYETLKR